MLVLSILYIITAQNEQWLYIYNRDPLIPAEEETRGAEKTVSKVIYTLKTYLYNNGDQTKDFIIFDEVGVSGFFKTNRALII